MVHRNLYPRAWIPLVCLVLYYNDWSGLAKTMGTTIKPRCDKPEINYSRDSELYAQINTMVPVTHGTQNNGSERWTASLKP